MYVYLEKVVSILMDGLDTIEFLNRVSASDTISLQENNPIRALFLTYKGKIIDFPIIFRNENQIEVFCSKNNSEILFDYFNTYIISEDILLKTQNYFKYTFFDNINVDFLKKISSVNDIKVFSDNYAFEKLIVFSQNNLDDYLFNNSTDLVKLSESKFRLSAFENFYLYDNDVLNQNSNPLECGLKNYISFSKGCYIGQEVIARIDNQNKVSKYLTLTESENEIAKDELIYVNENDKNVECGFVASIVKDGSNYFALVFVKSLYINEKEFFTNNNNILKIKTNILCQQT